MLIEFQTLKIKRKCILEKGISKIRSSIYFVIWTLIIQGK